MLNSRGAGRKPKLSSEQFEILKTRLANGEKLSALAEEFGIYRQAVYRRLYKETHVHEIRIDHMEDGELLTVLYIDPSRQTIRIENYTDRLSKAAFGWNEHPEWEDLERFITGKYLEKKMPDASQNTFADILCEDASISKVDLSDLENQGAFQIYPPGTALSFRFTRRDILYTRTDTDGFQMKALSQDRKWFIKSQAVMAGKKMNDWMVEAIASDLCDQLLIPHVVQTPCRLYYEGRPYMGVYSRNFELDGDAFISFERLLERAGKTSHDEEFIHLSAIRKMEWCARNLSQAGNLPYEQTLKYMLDLALIDCLVGNTDRHTKNFGLFYSTHKQKYHIPLIFDNGMGFFEHDYYRDEYNEFEDAMRTVYIEPYGEDPFDMLKLLMENFDLFSLYPGLRSIHYPDYPVSAFAREYQQRILSIIDQGLH